MIPDQGRSPMLCSNKAHVPQLLSLRSRAQDPKLLNPHASTTEAHAPLELDAPLELELCNKRSHHKEKPVHCN